MKIWEKVIRDLPREEAAAKDEVELEGIRRLGIATLGA
jgi:hypothetical protein